MVILLVLVGSTLVVAGAAARPVEALSCARPPNAFPAQVAAGTARTAAGAPFFDDFDFAVVGTVLATETVAGSEPGDWPTTVTVEVAAGLGLEAAPLTMTVSSPDPGFAGYPYEVGVTYFIPIRAEGPGGEPNYSFLCDPIVEIEPFEIDGLRALATEAGVPFAEPEPEPAPIAPAPTAPPVESDEATARGDDRPASIPAFAWALVAVALGAVIVASAAVAVVRRGRRAGSSS